MERLPTSYEVTARSAPFRGVVADRRATNASPILSNIYLDRLDKFVEQQLLPVYSRGRLRRPNPAYEQVEYAITRARRRRDREAVRALRRHRRTLPSQDPNDPDYRRLRYVRYADDWLLGFAGPKREAEEVKSRIGTFLRDVLKLELSDSKTLITHATTGAARFLGYEIKAQHADDKLDRRGQRAVNGAVGLFVPMTVIGQRCALYMSGGRPAQRSQLLHDDDFTIVAKFQAEYRGLVQYYLLAQDVFRLGKLRWVMETSLLKTLAGKHSSTVTKMARKYKATTETPYGPRKCFQSPSSVMGEGNRWSPALAGSRSSDNLRPSSPTSHQSWPAPGVTNSSTAYSPDTARSAQPRRTSKFTTSAGSLISTDLADLRDPHGCTSWPRDGARRS